MKVLSLFDGISCARVALERAGIPVETYWRAEIDKYANAVATARWPDSISLGDVREVHPEGWGVDLLIGGSPCQDLSSAQKDCKGLEGDRSGLFWEYVRIWKEAKPTWFILENVASMPKDAKALITETLGVEPVLIDAALVSAQSRKRLFWTNLPFVGLPEDRRIFLKDVLLPDAEVDPRLVTKQDKAFCIDANYFKGGAQGLEHGARKKNRTLVTRKVGYIGSGRAGSAGLQGGQAYRVYDPEFKAPPLGTYGTGLIRNPEIRKLDPVECERLQGLPDGYTEGVSNTQRYKCLGNAFHVGVIAWLLSFVKMDARAL